MSSDSGLVHLSSVIVDFAGMTEIQVIPAIPTSVGRVENPNGLQIPGNLPVGRQDRKDK